MMVWNVPLLQSSNGKLHPSICRTSLARLVPMDGLWRREVVRSICLLGITW
jgi:hypothetical protein